MTDVAFYHLQRSTLEDVLPKLLEKTLDAGKKATVMAGSTIRVEALTQHLWTYDQQAWLPHGNAKDGNAEEQPVWLTVEDENPNGAEFLFLTDGAVSARVGVYERCFELFDGRDDAAVEAARRRWTAYREAGHTVTYWQQNESGGWEKKG